MYKFIIVIIFSFGLLAGFSSHAFSSTNLSKIRFDLSIISPEGLIGSRDSLRSLDYEFCIHAHPTYVSKVQQIDPTIQVYPNSPGRINCNAHQYLCIGNTHQPNWKQVLFNLVSLPYIERIEQSFAE